MNPDSPKLQRLQSELEAEQQHPQQKTTQTSTAREFATPEEMLRHDAAQTVVPPGIKTRLADSVQQEPAPNRSPSWWQKLFR